MRDCCILHTRIGGPHRSDCECSLCEEKKRWAEESSKAMEKALSEALNRTRKVPFPMSAHDLLQPMSGEIEAMARAKLPCLRDGIDCTEFGEHGCVNCADFRRLMRELADIWDRARDLLSQEAT